MRVQEHADAIADTEAYPIAPPERVSASDLALLARMRARVAAAVELERFVSEHLTETYRLRQGDQVREDGSITRAPAVTNGAAD